MASPADQSEMIFSPNGVPVTSTQTEAADQSKTCFNGTTAPASPTSSISCILGLGTANPNNCYNLEEFAMEGLKMLGLHEMPLAKQTIGHICKTLGIVQKRLAFSPEIYEKHPSLAVCDAPNLAERFDIYEAEAVRIGKLAAERALADWGGDRDNITHLISYSSTMVLAPTLDVRLVHCLNLKPTVNHYSVSLLGCHGSVNGIRTAAEIAQADATSRVLVVSVEINSAAAHPPNPENPFSDLRPVYNYLLYGDGAGAVVIGRPRREENPIFEVHGSRSYLIPETANTLLARLLPSGQQMTIEKNFPALVGQNIGAFVNALLHNDDVNENLTYDNVNWAVHPGGKIILDAIEKSCKLNDTQLQVTRDILRNYGNMGSASILFLLDKFRNDRKEDEAAAQHPWTATVGYGPGVSMEGLLLKFSSYSF